MKDALSKMPVFRLFIPFLTGILLASHINIDTHIAFIVLVVGIILFILAGRIKSPVIRLTKAYYINSPLIVICISLGILNTNLNTPKALQETDYTGYTAQAVVQKIKDNDFSAGLQLQLISLTDTIGVTTTASNKITAWIEGSDYSLREGDIIAFKFQPQRITNSGNPEEFDYERFMRNKGFLYHTFIRQNDYQKTGHRNDFISFASNIRRDLTNHILNSSLSPDSKTFFITIILGDSSFFDKETRENLSHAGIAHILALSGLHIGIIALLLGILLIPLDYYHRKRIRLAITLICTIAFAFIVGLPVSVVRATIMIGFVLISRIIRRENSSINALFASALVILIANPFAIYDVGFQFSFVSVLFILLLSRKLFFVSPKREILYYVSSLVIISIVTMIGTMWLTAYYFNYISLLSIFPNLITIPILPIIVGCGIIYLSLLTMGIDWLGLARLLDDFHSLILKISRSTTDIAFSYIDNVYISPIMLVFCISALIFTILFIYKRRIIYVYCTIGCIIGAMTLKFVETNNLPTSGYVIFNDNKCTPILLFEKSHARIVVPDDSLSIGDFKRTHRKFLAKYQLDNISIENHADTPYLILGNKKVIIIKDSSIKHLKHTPKVETDIVLITKGFYGAIEDVMRNFDTKQIVISGDLYYKQIDKLAGECQKQGISCHRMDKNGAVLEMFY